MFSSCFEKLQFFSKISFLQKSVDGQLGTKGSKVLMVFADLGMLPYSVPLIILSNVHVAFSFPFWLQ